MIRKPMLVSGMIGYFSWLRRCAIQELCFFLSLSFLLTNLVFKYLNYFDSCILPVLLGGALAVVASGITYLMHVNSTFRVRCGVASFILIFPLIFMLLIKKDLRLFLLMAPVFFLISTVLWLRIQRIHFRHIRLFFSILAYILGLWFQMISLHNFPLRDTFYPFWDKLFNYMHMGWLNSSINLFSLTLLGGCLLIISWSPNEPCKQWNPFSAGTLMQSRRTATLAVGFSVIIFFADLDGHYRLSFVIFLMQLALNVTITIFCHTLQDDANTRRYVTEHILYEKQFEFSNLTSIHDKLSRVSQRVVSGIKKYGLREQSAYYEALLHSLVLHARRISADQPSRLRLWGIAIGFSSLPLDSCESEDLYKYAVHLYRFIVYRNAEDRVADDLYEYILLGLLLAMIKLCDESEKWKDLFLSNQDTIVHLYKNDLVIPDTKKNEYLTIMMSTMSLSVVDKLSNIGLSASAPLLDDNALDCDLLNIFSGAYRSSYAVERDIEEYDWR